MAYFSIDTYVGVTDMTVVDSNTPRVPVGTECRMVDATYGEGRAIYLAVSKSTAIPAGTLVYAANTSQTYQPRGASSPTTAAILTATAVPAVSTSKKTGRAVYVAMNAVASDANNVQFTWYLKKGITATLKTAVAVPADSAVYVSTTAGRFYLTASAGAQIIGARTVNAASVTSTTSTALVQFDSAKIDGYS